MKKIIHNLLVLLLTIIILYKFWDSQDEPLLISTSLFIAAISLYVIIKTLFIMFFRQDRWHYIKTANKLEKSLWSLLGTYHNIDDSLKKLQKISKNRVDELIQENHIWRRNELATQRMLKN